MIAPGSAVVAAWVTMGGSRDVAAPNQRATHPSLIRLAIATTAERT
jgi:hypothetical protein